MSHLEILIRFITSQTSSARIRQAPKTSTVLRFERCTTAYAVHFVQKSAVSRFQSSDEKKAENVIEVRVVVWKLKQVNFKCLKL